MDQPCAWRRCALVLPILILAGELRAQDAPPPAQTAPQQGQTSPPAPGGAPPSKDAMKMG